MSERAVGHPADEFVAVARANRRCVWLNSARALTGSDASLLGWCDADSPSLTYDARTGTVLRHGPGGSERVGTDIFSALERELARSAPDDVWAGYFGYASRPDLPATAGGSGVPDAVWMRVSGRRHVAAPGGPGAAAAAGSGEQLSRREYDRAFATVQRRLHRGDSYEVNLTYRARVTDAGDVDPVEAYLALSASNPAPYAGFLQHDIDGSRVWLLSSSPERYASIGADRVLETRPIKGTTPRSSDPVEDAAQAGRLRQDPKFRAENLMIVDLLRNDVSSVSVPGTVTVPRLMEVESYPAVHQLVSTVRGRLRSEVSTVEAVRALFPAGSMTGAPKLRTMEIISEVESTPRGPYAGAFGWIAADGRADLGVVIRSLFTSADGTWTAGTGGGITVDSDVDEEYAESVWKIERVLGVVAR